MRAVVVVVFFSIALTVVSCPRVEQETSSNGKTASVKTTGAPIVLDYSVVGRIDGSATPPGAFKNLSAVAVQDDYVIVADREYSAFYLYKTDGSFVGTIGCGLRVSDFMLSDEELLASASEYEEDLPLNLANEIALHRFYRVEDIETTGGHIFVLNSFFTSLVNEPAIRPCIFELDLQGRYYKTIDLAQFVEPVKLAVSPSLTIAVADAITNDLQITGGESQLHYANRDIGTTVKSYYKTKIENKNNPVELTALLAKHSNAGIRKEQYNGIGGIATYTPVIDGAPDVNSVKVIVCDAGNARIKVLDLRGNVLKLILGSTFGENGFKSPIDVAVDSNGNMFIVDSEKKAVFVIDKQFNMLGSFGEGELKTPVAIALSDSGDVFVADKDSGEIVHFSNRQA